MTILDEIGERTRDEVRRRRRDVPEDTLRGRLRPHGEGRPFAEARASQSGGSVIAEHKRRAPSVATPLREGANLADVVSAYERAGATALSVLTDAPFFGGSLEDLAAARAASGLPILRKDFIVHPYQVVETAAAGADAMLLIVAALEDDELRRLYDDARSLDLDVLVEVHDEPELERALAVGADLVGVNQRDLVTFEVDTARAERMAPLIPPDVVRVAESGVRGPEDARRLADAGYDAVLVGESLVTAADPASAVRGLRSLPSRRLEG